MLGAFPHLLQKAQIGKENLLPALKIKEVNDYGNGNECQGIEKKRIVKIHCLTYKKALEGFDMHQRKINIPLMPEVINSLFLSVVLVIMILNLTIRK